MTLFTKATKEQLKARVAISGPSGSGKTTAALHLATALADGGRIAVIDTERKSASLYSDRFEFDAADFTPPYDVRRLIEVIDAAAQEGYEVLVIDSLSHFWQGEGGLLEFVDAQGGSSFSNGWKKATPLQNRLVEKMLSYPGHLVATMRSKTAYAVDTTGSGKAVPRKVGQAAVQRDGLEYEFTLALDLDRDHSIGISKTRCSDLESVGLLPPSELPHVISTFKAWLNTGDAATLSSKAAKTRLMRTFEDRGWPLDAAKPEAARMWADAELTGDRVKEADVDLLIASVPRYANDDEDILTGGGEE